LCVLLDRRFAHAAEAKLLRAFASVGKLNPDRFAVAPAHAAGALAAARRDAQHELVRNGGGNHAGDFRAGVGEVAQDAGSVEAAVVNRRGRIPLDTKALAPLAKHGSPRLVVRS